MSAAKKKKNVHSRERKKNPQDNGDRLALIVFLTPFFGCYQFMRLAQNQIWAWLIPLALPRPFHSYCFEAIQIVLSAGLRWADFGKNGLSLGLCI